jgi:hypothetical protein
VHLHGGFGDPDIASNLFAKASACDLNHDLALPNSDQRLFILPPSTTAREADPNGVEKLLIAGRLGQEFNGAALHCLHRREYRRGL